jgi:putative methyltransferase (TIGR04325 family)
VSVTNGGAWSARRTIKRLIDRIANPVLPRPVKRYRYARHFRRTRERGLHYGVFPTFELALAAAPSGRPLGYDHPHAADLASAGGPHLLDAVNPRDYPVLYWLSSHLASGATSIFDFGGHVGLKYHAFRRYLQYPDTLRWVVCDMPAVVEAGRAIARERPGGNRLDFTTRPEDADGFDVFFASGSLQYVETPLPGLLARLERAPLHLVLNGLPVTDGAGFVTLQSDGHGFSPYWIQNRREFVRGLEAMGYVLRDTWTIPEKHVVIPFHEDRSVRGFTGFCFSRA